MAQMNLPSRSTDLEAALFRNRQLEAETQQLRTQVATLQERLSSLEQERDRERQDWARFKAWFTDSVERKQRKRALELQKQPTSDATPTASSGKKRKLLSQADEAILREVGIEDAIVKGLKGEMSSPMIGRDVGADPMTPKPKARTGRSPTKEVPSAEHPSPLPHQSPLQPIDAPSQTRVKPASSTLRRADPMPTASRRPRAPTPSSSDFESPEFDAPEPAKGDQGTARGENASGAHMPGPSSSRLPKASPKTPSDAKHAQHERDSVPSSKLAEELSPALTREQVLAKRRQEMEEMKRNPHKYKGKGRYAKEIPADGQGSTSLNALYEIVPEMNNGVAFAHNEVVRDRATRKQMHAYDCACCRDWYEAVGDAEPRVFVRDLPTSKEAEEAEEEERKKKRMQELRQNASRHRAFGPPPATPPSYWTIGFPTTQEAEEMQRKAVEADEDKRRQMDADPRYRRRKV